VGFTYCDFLFNRLFIVGNRLMARSPQKTCSIYVVELDKEVLNEKKFAAANPQYDLEKPCVYVVQTGRTSELRFEQHKAGYRSTSMWKNMGCISSQGFTGRITL
jgi:hypothetical protein